MTIIGYARVSSTDQSLEIQEAALHAAGCDMIRSEKRSGTTTNGRAELRTVLDFLRAGDVLMVTRIDRLARSIGDLQDIVRAVRAKGASLKATEQSIDTSTAAGKAFLDMLGVFAEFETNLRKERQLEGIAKAKAAGVYKGRPASIDSAKVREMKANGIGPSAIAKALKIGRAEFELARQRVHRELAIKFAWTAQYDGMIYREAPASMKPMDDKTFNRISRVHHSFWYLDNKGRAQQYFLRMDDILVAMDDPLLDTSVTITEMVRVHAR